jgi:hypothetical protein
VTDTAAGESFTGVGWLLQLLGRAFATLFVAGFHRHGSPVLLTIAGRSGRQRRGMSLVRLSGVHRDDLETIARYLLQDVARYGRDTR